MSAYKWLWHTHMISVWSERVLGVVCICLSQVGQSKNLFCPYTSYLTRAQGVKEFLRRLSETLVEKERLECLLALSICGEMQVVSLVKGEGGSRVFLDTWVLMVSLLCTEAEEYWEEEGMDEENSAFSTSFASCKQCLEIFLIFQSYLDQNFSNNLTCNILLCPCSIFSFFLLADFCAARWAIKNILKQEQRSEY